MFKLIFLVLRLASMDVKEANEWAALRVGEPSLVLYLDSISWRESKNERLGVHAVDSKWERHVRARAMKVGWLSHMCPFHWFDQGMSTNGPHGMMYAYNVKRLPVSCIPTRVYALPIVSAMVAVDRYRKRCRHDLWNHWRGPFPRDGWCPRNLVHPRKRYVTIGTDGQEGIMHLLHNAGTSVYYEDKESGHVFKSQPGKPIQYLCKIAEWPGWLRRIKEQDNDGEQDTEESTEGTTGVEPPESE